MEDSHYPLAVEVDRDQVWVGGKDQVGLGGVQGAPLFHCLKIDLGLFLWCTSSKIHCLITVDYKQVVIDLKLQFFMTSSRERLFQF